MAYDKVKKAKADATRYWRNKEEISANRKAQRLANKPVIRQGNPSREELRKCIEQGYCWWCQRSGWKRLGQHTAMAHQIYANDLRELAIMLKRAPTCIEEESEILRDRRLELLRQGKVKIPDWQLGLAVKHDYSEAGLISMRNNQKYMIESVTPAMKAKIAQETSERLSKPHPCPMCGQIVSHSKPIYCSEECRKQALADVGRKVGLSLPTEHFSKMGEIIRQKYSKPHMCPICGKLIPKSRPKFCSKECADDSRNAVLPINEVKARYVSGESSLDIAASYNCCDHTIRRHLRKAGIPIRPASEEISLPIADIKARYLAGESSINIAKLYGCSDGAVRRHLRNASVSIRTRGISVCNN